MLEELISRVTYPDEFFYVLNAIMPLLSEEEKKKANRLTANKSCYMSVNEIALALNQD